MAILGFTFVLGLLGPIFWTKGPQNREVVTERRVFWRETVGSLSLFSRHIWPSFLRIQISQKLTQSERERKLGFLNPTQKKKKKKMEAFGGYFVDEKAVRVETIFLDFLRRFLLSLFQLWNFQFLKNFVFLCVYIYIYLCIFCEICGRNFSFRVGNNAAEPYYEAEIEAMRGSESSTMFIDFSHVMQFNNLLQKAISDEYLRFEPYLKNACKRFVMEQRPTFIADDNPNKDINIAFFNLPITKRYNFF